MSSTTSAADVNLTASDSPPATQHSRPSPWLFHPLIDVLFIANLSWPLVLVASAWLGIDSAESVRFWQIYFVTTPHRWITAVVVFLDPRRFRERPAVFLGILIAVIVVCVGVRLGTGTLTCLLAVDYVWNAWHFAAQHHGIARIYDRLAGRADRAGRLPERIAFRTFILYVALRIAVGAWAGNDYESILRRVDYALLACPMWLILREFRHYRQQRGSGKLIYVLSVCSLYTSLLWAVHENQPGLVLALATASALFHATEYLAVVTWSMHARSPKRTGSDGRLAVSKKGATDQAEQTIQQPTSGKTAQDETASDGTFFSRLALSWGAFLAIFMVCLGSMGWLLEKHLLEAWLTINLMMAFLHYAYDGLIWKRSPRKGAA